jgi:hypothetical protein
MNMSTNKRGMEMSEQDDRFQQRHKRMVEKALNASVTSQPKTAVYTFGIPEGEMTSEQIGRAVSVYDYFDEPFDSHPDDVAEVYAAMERYVQTGELPWAAVVDPTLHTVEKAKQ